MRPDSFARLSLVGLTLDGVLRHYVDWLLGLGEFDRLRQRRLGLGILPSWTSDQLRSGAKLEGASGCRALVLHQPSIVRIRLVHSDETNPNVFWHSVARVSRSNEALLVEHAVGRTAPEGLTLEAIAAAPAVLVNLLDKDGVTVDPPELRLSAPVTIGVLNVPAFVQTVIGSARTYPIALVAPQGRNSAVDVVRLARSLRCAATVACLSEDAALDAFNRALEDHDGSDHGCADDAVRLYFPIPAPDAAVSHPTWLAERILRFPPRRRTTQLAAEIIGNVTARTLPPDFFGDF